jgi:hypothetical protein
MEWSGFGGRQFYSDHDEAIFDATCPMMSNAIPDPAAARQDFLDRAAIVEFLDMTRDVQRRGAVLARIRRGTTRILGALLSRSFPGYHAMPKSAIAAA